MAHVAVLAGGISNEREVSLRSGAAVTRALENSGHRVSVIDPVAALSSYLDVLGNVDVVFPALHGVGGEDGTLQNFLDSQGIPYIGSGSGSSKLCFDKYTYSTLLREHNILIPKTALVYYDEFCESLLTEKPFVLKPKSGGSSIDTYIVRDVVGIDLTEYEKAFDTHEEMLLQELITGVEITVGVLGDQVLPVIEIIPPENKEFDYENKYNGATQEVCPAVSLTAEQQTQAQQLAQQIHNLTACRDMSRTDIIVANDGRQYVLETNTIPGLTDQSLFPKAATTAGITMDELCDRLVTAALQRAQ
jgi:D-alanine-D-alanine ligase